MDYDALERGLRSLADWRLTHDLDMQCPDDIPDPALAADAIADLRARNKALVASISKIAPIVAHDRPEYAEVTFSDGIKHSSQAMTMNPQDWLDIQAAYEAAIAANREG